jgi:DNA-binding NarL/FixJ family response regulator
MSPVYSRGRCGADRHRGKATARAGIEGSSPFRGRQVQCVTAAETRVVAEAVGAALGESGAIHVACGCQLRDLALALREHGPSVVVLQQRLPGGAVTARRLRALSGVDVVIVGVGAAERELAVWASAGVTGCVAEDAPLEDLVAAVIHAAGGLAYCSPSLTGILFKHLRRSALDPVVTAAANPLTRREREVFELLREGMSNKEIAVALSLRVSTVKNHVHRIFSKLGTSRRGNLAKLAL